MTSPVEPAPLPLALRDSAPVSGYGLRYAIRTARAWWYSAWLRTLARFSRTYLGSFWLGLSNLLSVALLGLVYGTVLKVPNPYDYAIYLGIGLTVWVLISQALINGCSLLTIRRDHLVNNPFPAIFYCLEEWAFQLQTFAQAFAFILIAFAFIKPLILIHTLTSIWLPLANLIVFCLWAIMAMSVLGARFKDVGQLMPILLQLLFLVSPILYPHEGLGRAAFIADANPLYRILAPVRMAVIHGQVHVASELATLALNLFILTLTAVWLKNLRYRLPLWV